MSIYGSQLFKLYDKTSVKCIYVAWRKEFKKIWKIPNISHCRLYCPVLMIVITLILFWKEGVYDFCKCI